MMKPMTRLARPNCSSMGGMNELKMGHTILMPKKPKPRINVLSQGKDRRDLCAPVQETLPRYVVDGRGYSAKRFRINTALCPPKPKALLMKVSTRFARATLGT